jgi:hypothetical protein
MSLPGFRVVPGADICSRAKSIVALSLGTQLRAVKHPFEQMPLGIELHPVPGELIVRMPQTRGYDYTIAGDAVLLVSPLTHAVVGVFSDRD